MLTEARVPGCVFCGQAPPLTGEHVWPQWLRLLFPEDQTVWHIHREGEGAPLRAFKAPPMSVEARIVCKSCNTGWMHRLEETVRPLLSKLILGKPLAKGRPAEIDAFAQTVIATWALKTAMVLQYTYSGRQNGIPPAVYRELFERRLPNDGTLVQLGVTDAKDLHMAADGAHAVVTELGLLFQVYVVTLAIGRLVLNVHGVTGGPKMEADLGPYATSLEQIWPTQGVVRWPPQGGTFNRQRISALVNALAARP